MSVHAHRDAATSVGVIASSLAFFTILLFLLLTDYLSRPWPLVAAG